MAESRRFGGYVLESLLGRGGFGEVWKAFDAPLSRRVALKILRHDDPDERRRFVREAQTAASLNHPNIAAVFAVGESDGRSYLAMHLVDGRPLDKAELTPRKAAEAVRDAAVAVAYAHGRGVIHRDLKPANIMVDGAGRVFVMDFGLARRMNARSSLSVSGMVVGTPAYMPPEQARGEPVDERGDVYSLGATLYELLGGAPPFRGADVVSVLAQVVQRDPPPLRLKDGELETIVMRCLEKEPGRRYESANALAEDLGRWLEGEPILARAPSTFFRLRKAFRRRKAVVLTAIAGLALLIGFAGVVIPKWVGESTARARERDARLRELEANDRARPYVVAGNRVVEEMRLRKRRPHTIADLTGMAEAAERSFRRALDEVPDHPEALLGLARAWAFAWDKGKARGLLDRLVATTPTLGTAYLDRVRLRIEAYAAMRHTAQGRALAETEESRRVRAELEADLAAVDRLTTENSERLFAEAFLAFANADFERAIALFDRYGKDAPEDSTAHHAKGLVLGYTGRYAQAAEAFSRAIECDVLNGGALGNRGLARMKSGDLRGAIADFSAAIEVNPRDASALQHRGSAWSAAGDPARGIPDLTAAIEIEPSASGYLNRALSYSNLGDGARVLVDADRAIALERDNARAWLARSHGHRLLRDLPSAIADVDRAIELDGAFAEAFDIRGGLKGLQGDAAGAIADHTSAIRIDPGNQSAWYNRGNARMASGQFAAAVEDFTKAIELDPADAQAWTNRGVSWKQSGDIARAVSDWEKALSIAPADWPFREMVKKHLAAARR